MIVVFEENKTKLMEFPMASASIKFAGLLIILEVLLWSGKLYANGECYSSIISFGDSLADTGNMKQLAAISNQSFYEFNPPYGQNFINQSTGRCSNGRLIIDFLAESLGLPLIPPFVHKNGTDNAVAFKQGVNFAVAGATALDSSIFEQRLIQNLMTNASLGVQLAWFKYSLPSICGNALECRDFIGRSLILMGEIGGNDYNYLLLARKHFDEIEPLVPLVIDYVVSAVNDLIEMGAQTLVVPGNFPIGCSVGFLTIYGSEKEAYDPTTGCLVWLNEFAEYHNELLQSKLNRIRKLHPNVNIIYADYYNAAMQIYRSPDKFGFINGALRQCCGIEGSVLCGDASATVCDQPNTYVSWDGLHLTEAAYRLIHNNLFQGSYTTPQFNKLCPISKLQLRDGLSSSM